MKKLNQIFSIEIFDHSFVIHFFGLKIITSLLYDIIYGNPLLTSCSILQSVKELKKKGTKFPHPIGIVIAQEVQIGKNCTILQNVTIGNGKTINKSAYPIIGDNVTILAGAVVIGGIKVGDNAVIAANAVVRTDVEKNTLVAGVPAKFIKKITTK